MSTKKTPQSKKTTFRFVILNLIAMALVVCLAVFITMRWIDRYTQHGEAVMVPEVTRMSEEDAIQTLAQHELVGIVDNYTYVKGIAPGEVIDQRPDINAKVKRGRKIYLTISSGNQPMISIPDIADNSSLRQAESRLRAAGFQLAPNDTIDGEEDWVYGVRYKGNELKGGDKVPEGATLTLIIGSGHNTTEEEDMNQPSVDESWFE